MPADTKEIKYRQAATAHVAESKWFTTPPIGPSNRLEKL
jgi:hypothetical protein